MTVLLAHGSPYNPLSKLEVKSGKPKLEFPSNIVEDIGHYVRFGIREREKKAGTMGLRGAKTVDKALGSILLPMPSSLGTQYVAQYQDADLGAAGEAMVHLASGVVDAASGYAKQITDSISKGGVEQLVKDMGAEMTKGFKGAGAAISNITLDNIGPSLFKAATKMGKNLEQGLGTGSTALVNAMGGDVGKATIAASKGQVANPHRVVLFTGLPFREFQFSYKLSPRNVAESKTIRHIIFLFKRHMSPTFSATNFLGLRQIGTNRAALTYPDIFTIEFANKNYLFDFKPAVLKNFTIQYHPQSYPAYIRDDFSNAIAPAEVTISMTFQELDMIDRKFIEDEMKIRLRSDSDAGVFTGDDIIGDE